MENRILVQSESIETIRERIKFYKELGYYASTPVSRYRFDEDYIYALMMVKREEVQDNA